MRRAYHKERERMLEGGRKADGEKSFDGGLSKTIISVEGLRKFFDDGVEILKGIDLTVHSGDVLGIIGPSGSGKSTMLRCITQLEEVSAGTIKICGKYLVKDGVYSDVQTRQEVQHHTGLVFQNFNLFPHLTVMQNITDAPRRVLRIPKEEAQKEALQLLDRMGLSEKASAYPGELSGGQQQRVSIARALAMKPEVLLFDEPTSALDPELTGEVLKIIKGLAQAHITMVLVTHEMAFARDTSSHIVFMDGGMVVEEGSPYEVINRPKEERTKAFLSRFNGE